MPPPTPITNLHLASGSAIAAALSNLKGTFNGINGWQNAANNKYIIDTVDEIGRDFRAGSINNIEIVNYIATSACIHCFNGWSYLSSSINSLLEGDYGNAIHSAYYAELRGITSFLASQGIGVFNGNNVIIDQLGVAHEATPKKLQTHVFAKQAFDEWLNNPANSETLLKSFIIENSSLSDWMVATGFSTDMAPRLASIWLQDWSIDLSVINTEQKLRNYVSYNPQNFDLSIVRGADNIRDRVSFIVELWKLCSPNEIFPNSILRNTYEMLYSNLFSMNLTELDRVKDWNPILTALGKNPADNRSDFIIQFLLRQIEPANNIVFDYANSVRYSVPVLEHETNPIGIISRACLILLVNTKIVESMLKQSGTTKADLRFWFDNIGLKLGYWNAGAEPYLLSDLWSDVELELDSLEAWVSNPSTIFTPYNYKTNFKGSMPHFRHLGKACLWNIGL
ncbi:hypothetical protein [Mucilaginibacter gotjawali]|uniref:Uncharacterized protein n=2 Tax=Mucilaginibacter gotjawali TaxID=1550579 RepID=A0A110B150_9SPHI|nr:hypothetical protein [Mucilaginibacter gotjawali]MBB3057739.1 hypothetical protein [Mucilaginibacter gotjawali]BAU52542.1 hypothetical protein MgSA37_00704 [Mucilaginibacter gotjawali]